MTIENPNQKGTLGEIAVCKELMKLGYSVFVEFGSHSKVDLIVLDEDYITYKIQVKTTESKDGCFTVYSVKNCLNPKYNSTYTIAQVDIFAVYVIDRDSIYYISAKELLTNSKNSKFRLSPSKNGQIKNVRYAKDSLNFKKALRDCMPHVQTVTAVDDEPVQTTTQSYFAVGESQSGM